MELNYINTGFDSVTHDNSSEQPICSPPIHSSLFSTLLWNIVNILLSSHIKSS